MLPLAITHHGRLVLQSAGVQDMAEDSVFEHQRVIFLKGWSPKYLLPTERKRFSRSSDGASSDMEFPDIQCPSGWCSIHDRWPDCADRSHQVRLQHDHSFECKILYNVGLRSSRKMQIVACLERITRHLQSAHQPGVQGAHC